MTSLIWRRWRSSAALLGLVQLTVLVATGVVAAVPIYTDAVDRLTLRTALESAPADGRTIELSTRVDAGDSIATAVALVDELDLVAPLTSVSVFARTDQFQLPDGAGTELGSIDRVDELYEVVDSTAATGSGVPATMLATSAERLGLELGDAVRLERSGTAVEIEIVRLVAVRDAADDRWLDDALFRDGVVTSERFTTVGPVLLAPDDLVDLDVVVEVDVRGVIATARVEASEAASTASAIRSLPGRARDGLDRAAIDDAAPVSLRSTSDAELDVISSRLDAGGPVVTIVLLQVVAVALVSTGLAATIVARGRDREVRLQRLRGATTSRIVVSAAAEAVALVVPVAVIAPLVAHAAIGFLDRFGPLAGAGLDLDPRLASEAWVYSGAVGLIAIALVVAPAVGSGVLRHGAATAGEGSVLLDNGLDVVIAVAATLAIWRVSGAETSAGDGGDVLGADPVQVLAPALGVLAGAMVALRLVRLGSRVVERRTRRSGSTALHLASATLVRRPATVVRVVVVVVLAVAVGVFSAVLGASWERSQTDRADASVSADLAVTFDTRQIGSGAASALRPGWRLAAVRSVEGVGTVIPVDLDDGSMASGRSTVGVVALGADAADDVVRLRDDLIAGVDTFADLVGGSIAGAVEVSSGDGLGGLRVELEVLAAPSPGTESTEQSIDLIAYVRDGDGTIHRLTTEPISGVGPVGRVFSLDDAEGNRLPQPYSVMGFDLDLPITFLDPFDAATAEGRVDGFEYQIALDTVIGDGEVPLRADAWEVGAAPVFTSTVRATVVTSAVAGGRWVLDIDSGISTARRSRTVVPLRPVPTPGASGRSDPAAVPALLTRSAAQTLGLEPGALAPLRTDGATLQIEVVGTIEAAPFAVDRDDVIVVDWATLADRRFTLDGTRRDPRAAAASIAPVDDQTRRSITADLRTGSFTGSTVVDRRVVVQQFANDPVAVSLLGALSIAALGAVAVAIIVLSLSAVAAARERRSDAAALRAIGLPTTTVRKAVLAEVAPAVLVAASAAVATALVLGELVLDGVTIGSAGEVAVPPPRLVVPLLPTAGIAVCIILVGVACPLAVAGLLRRVAPADELRAGAPT